MSARPVDKILVYPDPRLRAKAEPVGEITPEIRERAIGLVELMNAGGEDGSQGIGLAATQVGWPVRIMVVKTIGFGGDRDEILVNPRVTVVGRGRVGGEEGCLSFPGVAAPVERAFEIAVEGTDLDGKYRCVAAEGIVARCLQHELDHLDGVLLVDRVMPAYRAALLKKLEKLGRLDPADVAR